MITRAAGMVPKALHSINPKFFLRNNTRSFKNAIICKRCLFIPFDLEMHTCCISPSLLTFNPHSSANGRHLAIMVAPWYFPEVMFFSWCTIY